MLGLCWPILGLCWPILGLRVPILGLCWAILWTMLAHLGAMLAHLGAMLAHLGAMLANLEAYVGLCWPMLTHLKPQDPKNGKKGQSKIPCKTQDIVELRTPAMPVGVGGGKEGGGCHLNMRT